MPPAINLFVHNGGKVLWQLAQCVCGLGRCEGLRAIYRLLHKHQQTALKQCPSPTDKRVTVHLLRHTAEMDLLQTGKDRTVIALWLGHERAETTQIYVEATLAMKETALNQTSPPQGSPGRYQPTDSLLDFLNSL